MSTEYQELEEQTTSAFTYPEWCGRKLSQIYAPLSEARQQATRRFLLHTLLPPLGGGLLIFGAMMLDRAVHTPNYLASLVVFLGYAYAAAIIPSALYAALMEAAARRGLTPGGSGAIVISGLIGLFVGVLPWLLSARAEYLGGAVLFAIVGFVVGVGVEWWVGRTKKRVGWRLFTTTPRRF